MMGPPGTGKTLSGRLIRNQANATFIWVSARDFHYSGAFGGLSAALDMAKELAPSVVFVEDVDNWLSDHTCDYLKSELDGIGRSNGTLFIMTTNYPEMLPEALIDRPGRFHDVLHFGLPSDKTRAAMLSKWLPGIDAGTVAFLVKETDGMSGAHVYELASFARGLSEEDGMDIKFAAPQALAKIREQRELITAVQLEGSHFRPHKSYQPANGSKLLTKDTDTKKPKCGHLNADGTFAGGTIARDTASAHGVMTAIEVGKFLATAATERELSGAQLLIELRRRQIENDRFEQLLERVFGTRPGATPAS